MIKRYNPSVVNNDSADCFYKYSLITNFVRKRKVMKKELQLIIKQEFFDAIVAGKKKQEFREVKPTTIKRYLQLDEEGFELEDDDGNALPIEYDVIRFFVGYKKDRDSAIVEVVGAHCEIFVDDNDEPIIYEHGVDKDGNPLVWVKEQVVYDLGKVLSINRDN